MTDEQNDEETTTLERQLKLLPRPLLIASTAVGRGMFSLGEALEEMLEGRDVRHDVHHDVHHRAIEDLLPAAAVREDQKRYRFIAHRLPILLHIAYRFPPVYMRKLLREKYFARTDLGKLERSLHDLAVASVVCVSHRAAFWVTCLKQRRSLQLPIAGLNGEYGSSLGWRYIFWQEMNAYYSPLAQADHRFTIPSHVRFREVQLPARRAFRQLKQHPGLPTEVLVVCGAWGQGPILRVVEQLLAAHPALRVHAVCGDDKAQFAALTAAYGKHPQVLCYGLVPSLLPMLERCGQVVTKPGISTLLEAHAAGRKILLLPGMPVAEDHNAHYALEHFGAEWFEPTTFSNSLAR